MISTAALQGSATDKAVETRRFRRAQWRMLLAVMFCYLFYYTGRQTAGFAIPGIHQELGISLATLGWMSTALFWCYALGQFINGSLGDRFGGRRMMTMGAVLSCGFNWITSFGTSIAGLFIPWGANGVAQSMGWAPGGRLLSNWWSAEERGFAFGFYTFAAGLSSVLAFGMSLVVIDVLHLDWRWIFRLPVLLMLLGAVGFWLAARDQPSELGFADNRAHRRQEGGRDSAEPVVEGPETAWGRYFAILGNVRFVVGSVAIGFQSAARYGLIVWVPVYFLGRDWKNAESSAWISLALPTGMALGALASGWISDRLFRARRSPVIILNMGLGAAAAFGMYLVPREDWVLGIAVLFLAGFFTYGAQSAFWALAPDLLGRHRTGTGIGVMNFFAYLVAGLSEPFIGWMIERSGHDYGLVFPIVGSFCLAAGVSGLFIRR